MNKETLSGLFAQALYRIPDYQRGYAWEQKQWDDFIQDIDALVDEDNVTSHYTGTIVVYAGRDAVIQDYGTRRLKVVDVVDGQQRLTTSCLYLSVIIRALRKVESAYERDIADFLYSGATCRLSLNNDSGNVYYDLLKSGRPNTPPQTPHEKRLIGAQARFQEHIDAQLAKREEEGLAYLKELYHAITAKLHFTFYAIEEECEIGMTFELMNSRGKGLSVLELLKNYLMHWVSRNEIGSDRLALTSLINKTWKDTYTNLGACSGNAERNEDQCLRIAWTLYCSHTPKNWHEYEGFKEDEYIPLRNFAKRSKPDAKAFIVLFAEGLAEISRHYAGIKSPTAKNMISPDELRWLDKIHRTGNIANLLPLMVAARKHHEDGGIPQDEYLALLKALECFAYRVFLWGGKRSNAGKSNFYKWGSQIFQKERGLAEVVLRIQELAHHYIPGEMFTTGNAKPSNWYEARNRLKYTLFEYELHLLETEGQGKQPHLTWGQISDATIEHILPQTPKEDSRWKAVWSPDDVKTSLHDIANLVLTQDNSSYLNFEYYRKKGKPGESPSYSNSDIRQERKISSYADWTPRELKERRMELVAWINERWKSQRASGAPPLDVVDEADEEDA